MINRVQETSRAAPGGSSERELSSTRQAVPGALGTVSGVRAASIPRFLHSASSGPSVPATGSSNLAASTWNQVQSSWGQAGRPRLTPLPPRCGGEMLWSSPSPQEGDTLQVSLPRVGPTGLGAWSGYTTDSLQVLRGLEEG